LDNKKMNNFDILENKRKHIRRYSDRVPDKEIIDRILWKSWKTSPSKNNAMPYEINVWGPDKRGEKIKIHSLCVRNHRNVEEKAADDKLSVHSYEYIHKGAQNPDYEHIKLNPYLFTIHSRLSKPNKFYQKKIEIETHFFDQQYESYINRIIDSVAVEVGLFAQNFTNYALEEGLDISYNSCFKRDPKLWHELVLPIKYRPILMITCGYGELYRRQDLKDKNKMPEEDRKPDSKDIIKWI